MERGFENCSSLLVKYFKLMVTSARFCTFFRGRSLVNVKCKPLNLSCVICKNIFFCILGCSIILFDGGSYRIETNQLICSASWLLGFYAMWDFFLWVTYLIVFNCFLIYFKMLLATIVNYCNMQKLW